MTEMMDVAAEFSLTDLVDFVNLSGTPKVTKLRRVKHRPPYTPIVDFYRTLRETIVETHQRGLGKPYLLSSITRVSDDKRLDNYPKVVRGYRRWWGRKALAWFEPPKKLWEQGDVRIRINPELGLLINGKPTVVKLYFKERFIPKRRAEIIDYFMREELGDLVPKGTQFAVLDVRRSRLLGAKLDAGVLSPMLRGELAMIAEMWPSL